MARIIMFLCAMAVCAIAFAGTFSFRFNATPLPEAIQAIMQRHPDLDVNFIYNELENYTTSTTVETDNAYDALRQAIGLNPVTVVRARDTYYLEAMQHGRYIYTGRVIGTDGEPVAGTTVLFLSPGDSTVITYAVADADGRFRIPCDRQPVIAKLSCLGYLTTCRPCDSFNIGTITMPENAVSLSEVKVEADNARLSPDRSTFIPTGRQKNAAQDAIDLLRQMALPLIHINPVTDAVTDNAGSHVAVYINCLEATKEELAGLRPNDVLRVEYLEFPTDPRFKGAQRVVNFILREYEYGGYTKLTAQEKFLIGLSNHDNIYSRFSYRKMTYDAFVGTDNISNRHAGTSSESLYTLTAPDGTTPSRVSRDETILSSKYRQNEYPVTFRATYNTPAIQIRNQIGYTHESVPVDRYNGAISYNHDTANEVSYSHMTSIRSNSLSYSGSYYFALPKGLSLSFIPTVNYSHRNEHLAYTTPVDNIARIARENATDYRGDLFLRKTVNTRHSLSLGLMHGGNVNRIAYIGAERANDRFHMTFSSVQAAYNLNTELFSLYIDGGYAYETNNINGLNKNDSYPYTHININYTPAPQHLLSTYFQLASNTPMLSMKSSNVVQENELLFLSGNPMLDSNRLTTIQLSYTWIPSNTLSINLFGYCETYYDRMLLVYEPYRDGTALKRSYINNGDWLAGIAGMSINWKPLGGKLQFYASPRLLVHNSTGLYDYNYRRFIGSLEATYYLNDFYFGAYWGSTNKSMSSDAPTITRTPGYHSLMAGWSKSSWNIRIGIANLFNKGWKEAVIVTSSPYFSGTQTTYGTSYNPHINLSVTYTIGYGKQVSRNNEVNERTGAASAILK